DARPGQSEPRSARSLTFAALHKNDPVVYPPRLVCETEPTTAIDPFAAETFRTHIELHHQYPGQVFVVVADYCTFCCRPDDRTSARDGTSAVAAYYLALGLDPRKATLYRQSDVPELLELAWIFSCLTPASAIDVTFCTAEEGARFNGSLGQLVYPMLMAAG